MNRYIIIVLGVFLLGFDAIAQKNYTISGTVIDKETSEDLLGVNIVVENKSMGTTTNEYGFYSISLPEGVYTLRVQYVGYKTITKELKIDSDTYQDFELQSISKVLDTQVVTANSPRINIRKPQMSVNRIDISKISKEPVLFGEVDVVRSLLQLPGVSNAGEGSSGFNVRGGASDQNLILLDEAILYNSSHLFGFFSVFNADAIRGITLYKAGIPAKYGGRVSSVLDIYQKEGNKNKYKFSAGIGLISSRFLAEGPIKKGRSSFLIGARSSYAHLFLKFTDNNNSAYFYDINAKLSYYISRKDKLFFSSYFGRDYFSLSNTLDNEYGNSLFNLRWNHLFSDKLFSNLSAIYSDYYYGLILNSARFKWYSTIKNINIKYDLKYYLSNRTKFSYGGQSIFSIFNPGHIRPIGRSPISERNLDNKYSLELALYTAWEQKFSDDFSFYMGLRYSNYVRLGSGSINLYKDNMPVGYSYDTKRYFEAKPIGVRYYKTGSIIDTFWNLEPRLSLSYLITSNQSLKASYNRMAQYMQLISNTTSATPLDVWAPSDRYLKPLVLNQYALGYSSSFADNRYSLDIETFYKNGHNRLDYIDGADLVSNPAIEREILLGDIRSYGLEFFLQKNVGNLTGSIAYTISRSEQRVKGRTPKEEGINKGYWYRAPFDKTHDLNIMALYKLNSRWTLGATFVFQSGLPITYPESKYIYNGLKIPNYGLRNKNNMPSYNRLDLSTTYTPTKDKDSRFESEWIFGIYNVYNRMNAYSIIFRQNQKTRNNEAVRLSIFGIVPSITYNIKF